MSTIHEHVMPPKTGHAVTVKKGQHLRITDLEGKQVVDVALFNADNYKEKLSTSNSRTRYVPPPGQDYIPRDHLTEGDTLMSTLCRPMMTIVADTPEPKGIHDVHNRMCNRFLFESHGVEVQDGCHEIIRRALPRIPGESFAADDIADRLYSRLLHPFADIFCLFSADLGGLRAISRHVASWLEKPQS